MSTAYFLLFLLWPFLIGNLIRNRAYKIISDLAEKPIRKSSINISPFYRAAKTFAPFVFIQRKRIAETAAVKTAAAPR